MKTTLMLTDFSLNADHAIKAAATLVPHLGTNILLYNSCYDNFLAPGYSGGPWVAEEFVFLKDQNNDKLSELAGEIAQITAKVPSKGGTPEISFQCGSGLLGKNVETLLEDNDVALIVVGSSTKRGMSHLLLGSEIMDVIAHASCPVLIIPPNAKMILLKKVTLAISYELADINAINYMMALANKLNFELALVHITTPGKTEDLTKKQAVNSFIDGLQLNKISYQEIKGVDVLKTLNTFCKAERSDMLALVHHQQSFIVETLTTSKTEDLLTDQSVPLLVIPSAMTSPQLTTIHQ